MKIVHYTRHGRSLWIGSNSRIQHQQNYSSYGHILIDRTCGFDLLRHANSVDDEWIQKLTKDELNFNEAITLLCTFGLVDPDKPPQQQVRARGYSVHSCVHSWIVFVLNKEWDKSLAGLALTCVASEVPDTNEKH